jgi:hypothetical protein
LNVWVGFLPSFSTALLGFVAFVASMAHTYVSQGKKAHCGGANQLFHSLISVKIEAYLGSY